MATVAPGPDKATKRDVQRHYASLRRAEQDAYKQGLANGERPDPAAPQSVHDAFDAGYQEQDARRPSTPAKASVPAAPSSASTAGTDKTPTPSSGGGGSRVEVADQGASFILGVFVYALVINYLRYGWPGVTAWLAAKFTNKTSAAPPTSGQVYNASPALPQGQQGGLNV